MKVALIGNMNNNNFALLRYLRDFGLEADLLLYNNELDHFTPVNDTWEIERWKPYIIKMTLQNNPRSLFLASVEKIREVFKGYDCYYGNGITPAYFSKAKIQLDFFCPYSVGIEYITQTFNYFRLKDYIKLYSKFHQKRGLKYYTKNCILGNILVEETKDAFKSLGREYIKVNPPYVYSGEPTNQENSSETTQTIIQEMNNVDLAVFSHVSHWWNFVDDGKINKKLHNINRRNDLLIKGFALFHNISTKKTSKLFISEYGPDVPYSKKLIKDLGISDYVRWLPKMPRKELLLLIENADICVGELGKVGTWGSTTWEFLAKGKPAINRTEYDKNKYEQELGTPFPPLINAKSADDISKVFIDFVTNREHYISLGDNAKDWFNTYYGLASAWKIKELMIRD